MQSLTAMSMNTIPHRRISRGFTLLEVLIAIVVVAFGLLGLAGLQVFALKNNQSASMRVTATNLTTDIIDRMKANYIGVINNDYNKPLTTSYTTEETTCATTGCLPAQLAANDLREWQNRVAATLPGGIGIVCLDQTPNTDAVPAPLTTWTPPATDCDGLGGTSYAVKIYWYDDRTQMNAANPTTRKYMYTAFNP
jgi:type IV pilus assembly protein PilV